MRRTVKRISGGAGPATECGAAWKAIARALDCGTATCNATGANAGIVKLAGLATSKETVPVAQCFSHKPPSPSIPAFICARATGSGTGPAHA